MTQEHILPQHDQS